MTLDGRSMRAVRLVGTRRPLEEQHCRVPDPEEGDVLVRVRAAGICHSDAHYRSGTGRTGPLPITLGHEVAGVVEQSTIAEFSAGDRVCIHYLMTCGECGWCRSGAEQFCPQAEMIGKDRDGGYADFIVVSGRSLVSLPEAVSYEEGAVMMCSASTSLHALRKARLQPGEQVAVFGLGGLGMAAVQLANILGARSVYAVDVKTGKIDMAAQYGAVPIDASREDPVEAIMRATSGAGVDVAVEVVGSPGTIRQSLLSLGIGGRAVVAGITDRPVSIATYGELIAREAEIIGVSDHVKSELVELARWVAAGRLDLARGIARTVPLEAATINACLDRLDEFSDDVRVVVVP